jgi:hypothetical protein
MTSSSVGWWGARAVALALVAVVASIAWRAGQQSQHADQRPIFIEPGQYLGPPDQSLGPAQLEAIAQRAQRQQF